MVIRRTDLKESNNTCNHESRPRIERDDDWSCDLRHITNFLCEPVTNKISMVSQAVTFSIKQLVRI